MTESLTRYGSKKKIVDLYHLVVPGRLPSLNELLKVPKGDKFRASRLKKEAEKKITWCIKQQLRDVQIQGRVILHYTWYEPNRRRDLDNIASAHKFVQDALVTAGVLQGDGWRHVSGFRDTFRVDKDNPRVEITIVIDGGHYE